MSEQDFPDPVPPEVETLRLAHEADVLTKDVQPDEDGEVGSYEEHVGRGVEVDPGEEEVTG